MEATPQFPEIIHVRVTRELAEAMRKAAERDDRTLSSWIRHNAKRAVDRQDERRESREVTA